MKKIYKILVIFVFLCLSLGGKDDARVMVIYYFDVGQADCIFITLPNGDNMLIDSGNNADGSRIVNFLSTLGVRTINHFIVTHPHEDHMGGADNILNCLNVEKLYSPYIHSEDIPTTLCYKEYIFTAKQKALDINTVSVGDMLIDDGALRVLCLSPFLRNYDELNEYSAVIRIDYFENSFLFMADAEKRNEKDLLQNKLPLKCDVLKIGHHGSRTSSCEKFLKTAAPEYAIISVGGKNDFGHPDEAVLKRLDSLNCKAYRTDLCKTVVAVCDGINIKIHTTNICLDGDSA